ncbi:MAG TPA: SBBP repeat-containing protein, partial [Ignavibacteria bacterium]
HVGSFYDYATVKYNTMGNQQWVSRFNGPGNSDDYANAIVVDASGNVYVTGEGFFVVDQGSDYATIKYSNSGVQQWVARYNGPGNSVDVAIDVANDGMGNVYVTGSSRGPVTEDDYATVKYNSSGVEQCVARYNGPGNTFDLPAALALDASGNIYVTGRSNQLGGSIITTIKYVPVLVSVQGQNTNVPTEYALKQNYPNPFNPSTIIRYQLPKDAFVSVKVYDLLGKEVAKLVDETKDAGYYEIVFDAASLTSGLYFYKMQAGDFVTVRKMVVVR